MNKLKMFIIILLFIAIIVSVCLFIMVLNIKEEVEVEQEIEDTKTNIEEVASDITTTSLYYNVNEAMKKYMLYEQSNNVEAIQSILGENSTDVLKKIIKNDDYIAIQEIYELDKISNTLFFTHAIVNKEDIYLVVDIDYGNYAFEIYASTKDEIEKARQGIIDEKYKKDNQIQPNEYNTITREISDIAMIQMYYDNYKDLLYYEMENSFEKIEPEYKLKKFNNDIENYEIYRNNNMDKIMNSNIIEYWLERDNADNPIYIFRDTNDNYITINVKENVIDYTISLDNYTVETQEFMDKYNKASSKEKIETNLAKVFKWINEKQYDKVYEHLDETFRANNFPTLDAFNTFMNNKFFDRNIIQTGEITEQGSNYIITINYASNESVAAEHATQTIIMQLKEGTDFVMSFQVQ